MFIYAHRGNSSVYPENTMPAFRSAVESGAHGIETDVHCTSDGVLVLTHDEEISKVSDGKGMIKDMTYAELLTYDFGSWKGEAFKGERIPRLEELLDLLEDTGMMLNIELKMGFLLYPDIEEQVLDLVKKRGFLSRVIFSSFNHYSLDKIRKLDKDALTAPLYTSGLFEPYSYALTFQANAIHPYYLSIDRSIVEECHKRNLLVNLWTVNDPALVKTFEAMGIDGIITDHPQELMKILRS